MSIRTGLCWLKDPEVFQGRLRDNRVCNSVEDWSHPQFQHS